MTNNKHDGYINSLSEVIHQDCVNVGWWDDPNRCLYTCIQLISTEVAEATEGDRKNLMDDHLEGFRMEEVELCDALIRLLDLGGKLQLMYDSDIAIVHHWCSALNHVGKQHLGINQRIIKFADALADYEYRSDELYKRLLEEAYGDLIKSILQVAHNRGYTFFEALELKIDYNRKRADHKREARAAENGKKY